MKKICIFSLLALFMCAIVGCSSCSKQKKSDVVEELNFEDAVASDFNKMTSNYVWYESTILLDKYLDEENDGKINEITNVFQIKNEKEKGFDTQVIIFTHTIDGVKTDTLPTFMVDNFPMVKDSIKVDFKQAFDKVMSTNMAKPQSRYVVLRNQVGPKQCNPQYIFGNTKQQIYLDAVNGNVSDKNPAFEGSGITVPLGEWP